MTSNQMIHLRKEIKRLRQNARDALARNLREHRHYQRNFNDGISSGMMSYHHGCIVELRMHLNTFDSLSFTLEMMEDFNAYA